jgi:LemA protein
MSSAMSAWRGGASAVLVGFFLSLITSCTSYDELVDLDASAAEKWANVEAQLQRRSDLVPQLVAVVRGAAKYEAETLEAVVLARAEATRVKLNPEDLTDPEKMQAFQRAQDGMSSSLARLLVVQEQYPELTASRSYRDLQVQLEGTENRVLRAREEYNAAVGAYNSAVGRVRGQVVNKATNRVFVPRVFFSAASDAKAVPSVSF